MPAWPRPTSAMSCWKPSRPTAEDPERPWSWSMTVTASHGQPSSPARWARSYCRAVLAVFSRTCMRVDWRMETKAPRSRCSGRILGVGGRGGMLGLLNRRGQRRGDRGVGQPGQEADYGQAEVQCQLGPDLAGGDVQGGRGVETSHQGTSSRACHQGLLVHASAPGRGQGKALLMSWQWGNGPADEAGR